MHRQIVIDEFDTERFKANRIVRFLLSASQLSLKLDLDSIWEFYRCDMFSKEELKEFYQLIGYSVSGYGDVFGDELAAIGEMGDE